MFLFEDPDSQLKKFQQTFKFHKKQQSQYISFLEHKIKTLMQENNNLRKSIDVLNNNTNYNTNIINNNPINLITKIKKKKNLNYVIYLILLI